MATNLRDLVVFDVDERERRFLLFDDGDLLLVWWWLLLLFLNVDDVGRLVEILIEVGIVEDIQR